MSTFALALAGVSRRIGAYLSIEYDTLAIPSHSQLSALEIDSEAKRKKKII